MKICSRKTVFLSIAGIVIILIGFYLFITSSYFITTYCMPYVSKVMGMNFSADEVELSFVNSRLTLKNVSMGYIESPFLTGKKGTCRFDIFEIFKGNIKLYDVEVFEGHLNFIKDPHGKWNLPELYEDADDSSNEDIPVILNFTNIKAYNSSLVLDINGAFPESRTKLELINLDIICPSLKSYSNSSLTFKCDVILDQGRQKELIRGNITASAKGFVNDCLAPDNLQSIITLKNTKSRLNYFNLNGKNFEINSKFVSPDYNNFKIDYFEVTELNIKEKRSSIKFNGDLNSFPFRFTFSKCIINLFPDLFMLNQQDKLFDCLDISQAELIFKGQFDFSNSVLNNSGKMAVKNLLLISNPSPLTLDSVYKTSYNFLKKQAVINKFSLSAKRDEQDEVVSFNLHEPLSINFKEHLFGSSNKLTTANFNFQNANLKYFNNFIDDKKDNKITSGVASGDVKIIYSNLMKLITFKGNFNIKKFGLCLGAYVLKDIDILNTFDFNLEKLNNFIINSNQLEVSNNGQKICNLNLSGNFNSLSSEGVFKFKTGKINDKCEILLPKIIIENDYYKKLMKYIAPVEVDFNFGFKINRLLEKIKIKSAFLSLKKDKVRTLSARISSPVNISWNENRFINEDIRLILKLNKIELSLFNILMNENKANLYSGNLNSVINYTYFINKNINRLEGYNVFSDIGFCIDNDKYSNIKQIHNFFDVSVKYSLGLLGVNGLFEISRLNLVKSSNKEENPIGQIKFDMSLDKKLLKFNHLTATLNNRNHMILDLNSTASIPIPSNSGVSSINLNSEKIDLKTCLNLYDDLFLKNNGNNLLVKPDNKKLTSISNRNYFKNIYAKLNLKNIQYGPYMSASVNTDVTIKNSWLQILPGKFYVNRTPINFNFDLLFNEKKNYPYSFKLNFKNFQSAPVFSTLNIEGYKQASSLFENVAIDLKGKGFPFSNKRNDSLSGSVKIDIKDISLPDQARKYKLLRIIFIPLEVFSIVEHFIPGGLVSRNLMHSLNSTIQIFSLSRSINFASGQIYLTAVGKKILLDKVLFIGSDTDLINKMSFKGYINLNQQLDLITNTNIGGILVPLDIKGTISNPIPGIMMFLINFSKSNTISILNPMNLLDFLKGATEGFTNTLKGTYDVLSS